MRRRELPPPQPVLLEADATLGPPVGPIGGGAVRPVAGGGAGDAGAGTATAVDAARPALRPPGDALLGEPVAVVPRLRRLFDPVSGWFRRLERRCNLLLSERVYHLIPGLHRPYTFQLDRWLTVSRAAVELPGLPDGLRGMRILLITDIHTGPFVSPRCLERTFARLASLAPDLVLVAGDFATCRVGEFLSSVRAFAHLAAPLGAYGVMGNHDHYTEDPELLRDMIEKAGVRVLHNTALPIRRNGERLILAGIDDLLAGSPDLDTTLAAARALRLTDRPARAEPIVLLSHNPDVFFDAARGGASLVLAGHTHAGQVRLPGLPTLVRMSRYSLDQGRYRVNGSELIVSRGLGAVGVPLRIGCPPEAVLIELR